MHTNPVFAKLVRFLRRRRGPGYIDHFDSARVAGWVRDPLDTDKPSMISVYIDGTPTTNIISDIPREDVQAAGLGPLVCGFDIGLPRYLKDGKPHVVELRLASSGQRLHRGLLKIEGEQVDATGEGGDEDQAISTEGVAWFSERQRAITGWAMGATQITVQFDDMPPQVIELDRIVPGFGSGARQGFFVQLPPEMADGEFHDAQILFASNLEALDGSPVLFRLRQNMPSVTVQSMVGARLVFEVKLPEGASDDLRVTVLADGRALEAETRGSLVAVDLPSDCSLIVVAGSGSAEAPILARFQVQGHEITESPVPELPPDVLDDKSCAAARAAFDSFCKDPDDRFDGLWYCAAYPGVGNTREQALKHYLTSGAAAGCAPGPSFDETTARHRHPMLEAAIADGRLPCAFALELLLGDGSLGNLSSADSALPEPHVPPTAVRRAPSNVLPSPAHALDPEQSIYAAWVSRLEMSRSQRAELVEDERNLRKDIKQRPLSREPLVSIIMPSWNRAFTIGEAIQSVLDQNYDNWELIVSDDASEDRTAEVVRGFNDPRIRYMKFLKSNGAGARNKGLGFARGEYIAYLDSDNLWHPQFLDLMIRRLLSEPGTMIAYSAYLNTETEGARVLLREISRPSFRQIALSSKNFMDLNTIVHHRRLYDWMGGFDGTLLRLQDWDLALRYTSIFRPIYVNRIGVFYRRNKAWGQVTHLHMNSGAQGTVNTKTQRRLTEQHETLDINWPARGRITVLAAGRDLGPADTAARLEAESLARMAAHVSDVDLFIIGNDGGARSTFPVTVTRHDIPEVLCNDPVRLGNALRSFLGGRPVLATGAVHGDIEHLTTCDPELTLRLQQGERGSGLRSLAQPDVWFDLGALPLPLPDSVAPGGVASTPHILFLLPQMKPHSLSNVLVKLASEAQRQKLHLLIPPARPDDPWTRINEGVARPCEVSAETGLPDLLAQCTMSASLCSLSELSPFGFAVLTQMQGRGVPAAVPCEATQPRDEHFEQQWFAAKAAYEITVKDPAWILGKMRKLQADKPTFDRMCERSRTVHQIALHSSLTQERLNFALYRLLFDPPNPEMPDAGGER